MMSQGGDVEANESGGGWLDTKAVSQGCGFPMHRPTLSQESKYKKTNQLIHLQPTYWAIHLS